MPYQVRIFGAGVCGTDVCRANVGEGFDVGLALRTSINSSDVSILIPEALHRPNHLLFTVVSKETLLSRCHDLLVLTSNFGVDFVSWSIDVRVQRNLEV